MSERGADAAARGERVLDALSSRPGGPQLTAAARERTDVALVGGAVRDLLLGREPRELDVAVDGDAGAFAGELAALLGASVTLHERFGTAAVEWEAGRVDVAARRAETYARPGALPDVRPGSAAVDLARRDFTVNAIAVALGGDHQGELDAAEHALEDLAAGRLRVLHEQSFRDDPTRLLRLARYRARLGLDVEERTARLAADALADGALATVSGARVGAELRLALGEANAAAALGELDRMSVLAAIAPDMRFAPALFAGARALLPADGRADLLALAGLLVDVDATAEPAAAAVTLARLLDSLELSSGERDRVIASVLAARSLPERLADAHRPSRLAALLAGSPPEAVALAGADGGEQARAAAARWLEEVRHVRLAIGGDDLLAAGVPAGPELGARLAAALARKQDGELDQGEHAELAAALEWSRG